jgi:hypothetical protein
MFWPCGFSKMTSWLGGAIASWLGGGVMAVAGIIGTAVTFVFDHKDSHKEPTAQIQEALTGQQSVKDAKIAAKDARITELINMLLEKNPAAGPGAQQALGAAVGCRAGHHAGRKRPQGRSGCLPQPRRHRRAARSEAGAGGL